MAIKPNTTVDAGGSYGASLPTPGAAGRSVLENGMRPGSNTAQPVKPVASTTSTGTVQPGTRTPPTTTTNTTSTTPTKNTPKPSPLRTDNAARAITPEQLRQEASIPGGPSKEPTPTPTYSGGGGGAPAAAPAAAVDTTPVDSLDSYYGDAAGTTKRIADAVDMSKQIQAADAAWSGAVNGYSNTANQTVDAYQKRTQQGIDAYGDRSAGTINDFVSAIQNAAKQYGNASNQNIGNYDQAARQILSTLSGVTGKELADYAKSTGQTIADATKQINDIIAGLQDKLQPVEAGRVGRVDTVEQENLLRQIVESQKQQSQSGIDYAVQQGVNELTRAEEDAQEQFQAQRNQIAAEERNALDNQALYSEMRGDRGGIGQAQYNSIQNTAATNQLTVNKEQTKLATDTARQIADLRAKGEFQKADELLSITQSYLSQLMQLKQWADETNVGIDEFNIGVEQWEQEYNAKIQQTLAGMGMEAVQYTTGLNMDNAQYLTGQRLSAAQNEASMGMSAADRLASMRENTALNQANMARSNASDAASMKMSNDQYMQNQRQSLNDALAQYGLANAKYVSDTDISRISNILSAYQTNANNKASTELSAANMTGAFSDATPTQEARARVQSQLASAGEAMISAGLTPSDEQLSAMGWTKAQYNTYKAAMDAAKKRSGSSAKYIVPLLRDMVDAGKPLEDVMETVENAIASGKYSDNDAATEFTSGLQKSGWDGKNG